MIPNVNANPSVDPRASTPSPLSHPPSPPLQRGKACLSCRRRKMKCDGARPVCTPCLRGERTEDCEYTDGQHRPRTLALEEDVARLRARVWELEHPGEVMPSVELHAPYVDAGGASSAMPSPRLAQQAPSFLPHHHAAGVQPHRARSTGSASPLQHELEVQVDVQHSLSVVAPYAAELGLFLNPDRLRTQGVHVLPALRSALALWSVRIASPDPNDAQSEERSQALITKLLSQTQTQLASALNTVDTELHPTVFLQIIQAGILLAYHMQRIGQMVGARYYASGTWTLVMLSKLYQHPCMPPASGQGTKQATRDGGVRDRLSHAETTLSPFAYGECARLPPPLDGIEAEERVRAFWVVYSLDRWFSVVTEGQCQPLPSGGIAGNAMTVPWPGTGGANQENANVVQHLLNDPNHSFTRNDPSAMYAKAAVLLGEALEVVALFLADRAICQSREFQARLGTLDSLLQHCLNAAMAMAVAPHGQRNQTLMAVHLVSLAHLTLHRPFISTYGPSRRRCLEGAMGSVRVLERIGDLGLQPVISPIYAVVWTAISLGLHEEILRLRARPDTGSTRRHEEAEVTAAIRKLIGMLSGLSQHCPSKFFAAKIEAVLPILESISV